MQEIEKKIKHTHTHIHNRHKFFPGKPLQERTHLEGDSILLSTLWYRNMKIGRRTLYVAI